MTQEQFKALDPKVASHREELIHSQQGELNAVLMYQRLAKVVKTDKERETFLQLAKEEGRHASVFHAYTHYRQDWRLHLLIIVLYLVQQTE